MKSNKETYLKLIQNILLWSGPTISLCWLVTALLDIMDGSVAILSGTTSQLGDTLDHMILDPLGAWLALMAARQDFETVGK